MSQFNTKMLILSPAERKIEARNHLKNAFDSVKLAHDTLLEHKLLDQETANNFTVVATIILELGKSMNLGENMNPEEKKGRINEN